MGKLGEPAYTDARLHTPHICGLEHVLERTRVSSVILQLNKPYIAFVASAGTGALAFIGWAITAQVYKQWLRGLPITGGWNWPIVLGVDLVCLLGVLALYWKIYADSKTTIDATGLSRPSLRGPKHIAWSEVTAVKVFNGVGFHVCAGNRKIVVTPYAYREPERVVEALRQYSSHIERSAL